MPAEATALVLGCGIGGVVAATELRKRLPDDHRVVVIDREARASFPPSYLWVMTGDRKPASVTRERGRISRKGIEFVNADIHQIDLEAKVVRADSRELKYDWLVVALGAQLALDGVPGLVETAQTFYSLDGAERLAASLRYFSGGRVAIVVAGTPFKCPAAPYEAAMLLEDHFLQRRLRQKVDIEVFTPERAPLPIAGPGVGAEVAELLAHKGIGFHAGHRLQSVDSTARELVFQNGLRSPFDLLIAVPEHRAPTVVAEAGLLDETGWVAVDPESLETAREGVFAIGDVNYVTLPDGMLLPKAGVFAEGQAHVVARTIAARARGQPGKPRFDGTGRCFLEVGSGAAAIADGDFYAHERRIQLKQPSIIWHWAKVAMERYWLWRWY